MSSENQKVFESAFRKLREAIKIAKPKKITLYRGQSGKEMRNVQSDKMYLQLSPKDQSK